MMTLFAAACGFAPPTGAKNVLLILVDDLRPQLGCYNITVCGKGNPMKTPNIDALASRGVTFRHAYNQYSVCSPSRNSFLSGRRPDTTLTYNFIDDFRKAPGGDEMVTLPEMFKLNGYNVTGCGKTFHPGHPKNWDQPRSWTEGLDPGYGFNQGLGFCGQHSTCVLVPGEVEGAELDGCRGNAKLGAPAVCPDHAPNGLTRRTDEVVANYTVRILEEHRAAQPAPWFHAVGFVRPHVDWSAPQEFWDLYKADRVELPLHKTIAPTAPKVAWVDGGYCDKKKGDLCNATAWARNLSSCTADEEHFDAMRPIPDVVSKVWRRGYYAAVSYVDSNIGKVLTGVDRLGYRDETVVGLLADHGYQLGEHAMWEKYTNWELAARVPFILAVPWKPKTHGQVSLALVESVDMHAATAPPLAPHPPTSTTTATHSMFARPTSGTRASPRPRACRLRRFSRAWRACRWRPSSTSRTGRGNELSSRSTRAATRTRRRATTRAARGPSGQTCR